MYGVDFFSLAINVHTEFISKKSACTLIVCVRYSEKYIITACWAKVKFNAQKEHECMTVTFGTVVLYGNDIQ